MNRTLLLAAAPIWAACSALAGPVDPTTLYELTTQGSTDKVKAGEKGVMVIEIRSKVGAHVSEEAPLKIELTGREVRPEKDKLTIKDSVGKKESGQQYANPRFEIPFQAAAAGKGAMEAKVTFFICTDKLCVRQQKALRVDVEVL
ncbi:MAG: hypothetical protein HYZ28_23205 [Myxococcales bacterium]|nr:hypothetical protein [Myxococcales bacterium]